ncbi:MAG TPA: methionyl-tRNA formyltransferase [Nitrospira sp.]|nr:methionyl-tRNA formyltransferase [Nitrospira sp.]MCC7471283.1 methionyl-tRNA formyltransferase [Candidatus Nomurabacteria bacterium]HNA27270.1 methionyl-tRNA formyltransferase [Nitrospira sp.]
MRIVFMGTPDFAVPSLEALIKSGDEVVGVVTQPDRPKGRGQEVISSPVKVVCQREGIPVLQPLKMKDPAFLDALRQWAPDVIAVTAFGRILPPVILTLPPHGCINVHGSLLPKYRGAGPVQWAIIRGERETGITTMFMAEGMDTGDMLLRETVEIRPDDTAGTLAPRLAEVGGRLLVETLRRLKAGTLVPQPQDDTQATLAPLLKKEDGSIDWTMTAVDIANRARGLSPWPGAYTFVNGERWTLWRVQASDESSGAAPGTVTKVGKDRVEVATGRGTIHIMDIQPSNSRRMTMAQYLAGHRFAEGLRLQAVPPPAE